MRADMPSSQRRRRIAVHSLTQLTAARIVAVPVIMALLIAGEGSVTAYAWAGGLFAVAAATDFLDGYLARRWDVTTTLGSFLDTTADKLLVAGVLIALVEVGRAWAWVAVVIVGRELVIMGLRGLIATSGSVMSPSIWGKLKAAVQFLAILLAIWRLGEPLGPLHLDQWAMIVAAGVTVMSGWEYLARFWSVMSTERE